jgi:hypothetical protein
MSFIYHRLVQLFVIGIILSPTVGFGLSYRLSPQQTSVLPSQEEANLSGYVTDMQMNPLSGALVRVSFHNTYEENYSNSEGYYHVSNIPLCYCLKNATCSKPGYHTQWVLLSISENTTYDFILTALNESCYPVFNGTIGNNGWYISCVNITFVINGDVDAIFYRLDSGMWTQYTGTFEVCQNGLHTLYWYWTVAGEESATLSMNLLIDHDSPDLQVTSEWNVFPFTVEIHAEASDGMSGMRLVEFFVDDFLYFIDTTFPYDFLLELRLIFLPLQVKAIAFDAAGNSANATLTVSLLTQNPSSPILSWLFQIFSYIKDNTIIST